jgi:hypothetical protein
VRQLVTENFRYPSGQVASGASITVYTRGTTTLASLSSDVGGAVALPNPLSTDAQGNLSFYVDPGSYDFYTQGARVPFDVETDAGGAPEFYTHTQTIPNATWTIIHNLGFRPQVAVVIDGEEVLADVSWPDLNTVIVTLDIPRMGQAHLS